MFMKTLALTAALGLTATVASANNTFGFGDTLKNRSTLSLDLVRSSAGGVVEIYDDANGQLGRLLGTKTVRAGANKDVRVNIGRRHNQDVIAVLRSGGQIVATQEFDLE